MTLPHQAGARIAGNVAFSRAPAENQQNAGSDSLTGVVRGIDPRTRQAIVELDQGGQVRVAIPTGGRAFPGQVAVTTGRPVGGVYRGSFYFNDFQRTSSLYTGFAEITYTGETTNTPTTVADSCDIDQNPPTSPLNSSGGTGCPKGFSPNCGAPGTGTEGNCFGCKADQPVETPTDDDIQPESRPNLPGDPGDGCGGSNDSCDWYQGTSCPTGTYSKGFVEFPAGTFRSLCCGSSDRPTGDGCDWQGEAPDPVYSPNEDGNACEINPSRGNDGRNTYGSLASCEDDLFDQVDQWNPANTNNAGSYTAPSGFTIVAFSLASGTGWNNSVGACGADPFERPCSTINPSIQPGNTVILPGNDQGSWGDNCSDCVYNVFLKAT